MNKLFGSTAIVLSCVIMIAACQHKNNNPVPSVPVNNNGGNGNDTSGNNTVDTGICFTRDILPIFISNCAKAGCHDAVTKAEGFQFTDYNTITSKDFVAGNAAASELYQKMTEDKADKIMPPPPSTPLTAAQKELVRRWINEGAKNTSNCGTQCDTNKFTFAADIKPITDKYCKGCHSGAAAPKGILLDSYTGVSASANGGRLLGAIKHTAGFTAMPQGGSKLTDCEIRQVEKWIAAGSQNN